MTSEDFDYRRTDWPANVVFVGPCAWDPPQPLPAGLSSVEAPNATVEPFIPHRRVLVRASCMITHGGMGATQKALAHGVPVCAVPFGRDQFEVARRLEQAAAGTRLDPWRLRPDRLRARVRQATLRRPGAERIARSFAASEGGRKAAEVFERRLLRG